MAVAPDIEDFISHTVYEVLGWTFQERILARSCLYLTDTQAYFSCMTSPKAQREDGIDTLGHIKDSILTFEDTVDDWHWQTGCARYCTLVKLYSRRKLPYDSDIINAFSGIASILEARYGGAFIHGLPESIFDLCLLCLPTQPAIKRRLFEDAGHLPSWSWAGWIGGVAYLCHLERTCANEANLQCYNPAVPSFYLEDNNGRRLIKTKRDRSPGFPKLNLTIANVR